MGDDGGEVEYCLSLLPSSLSIIDIIIIIVDDGLPSNSRFCIRLAPKFPTSGLWSGLQTATVHLGQFGQSARVFHRCR